MQQRVCHIREMKRLTIWHIYHIIIKESTLTEFEIIFYEKENGDCPVQEFLDSLDTNMRTKMVGLLGVLEEKGNCLREPYSKLIDDGIFEIRCKVGNNITRVLYFFYYNRKIVLTNGFVKKTRKTPIKQIKLAKQRRADFKERMSE